MNQVANITNSSKLEKQVLKDAQFWLPQEQNHIAAKFLDILDK